MLTDKALAYRIGGKCYFVGRREVKTYYDVKYPCIGIVCIHSALTVPGGQDFLSSDSILEVARSS